MNTTKGEDYGWFEMALNQFPVAGKRVLLWAKNHGMITGSWNGKEWESSYGVEFGDKTVTHWRHLPEPPKPKDGFEAFWDTLTPDECRGNEFRYAFKNHGMLFKPTAKLVWEAAINSTKQC